MLNGVRTQLITLLPSEESSEIILAKLYVGTAEPLLYKAIITTKSSGNFTIDYTYSDAKKFALPSRMVFTIDVKKFKMPKSVASNIRSTGPTKSVNQDQKGTITITFSNYLINKGISDSFFTKN
jgi:outer membrane lipoprotein-sorting protein